MNQRWLLLLPVLLRRRGRRRPKADNIWDRRDPRYANLFQDNRRGASATS